MVIIPLDIAEWIAVISTIVLLTAYFVRQEARVRRSRNDIINQAATLEIIITYMIQIMDRDKALEFIQELYRQRGR